MAAPLGRGRLVEDVVVQVEGVVLAIAVVGLIMRFAIMLIDRIVCMCGGGLG
jgi:hypothetical protein